MLSRPFHIDSLCHLCRYDHALKNAPPALQAAMERAAYIIAFFLWRCYINSYCLAHFAFVFIFILSSGLMQTSLPFTAASGNASNTKRLFFLLTFFVPFSVSIHSIFLLSSMILPLIPVPLIFARSPIHSPHSSSSRVLYLLSDIDGFWSEPKLDQKLFYFLFVVSLQFNFSAFNRAAACKFAFQFPGKVLDVDFLLINAFHHRIYPVEFLLVRIYCYALAFFCNGFTNTQLLGQTAGCANLTHCFFFSLFCKTVSILATVFFMSFICPGLLGVVPVATWALSLRSSFLSSSFFLFNSSSLFCLSSFIFIVILILLCFLFWAFFLFGALSLGFFFIFFTYRLFFILRC